MTSPYSYPQDNKNADPAHPSQPQQLLPDYIAAPAYLLPQPQRLAQCSRVLHVYHEGLVHRRTQILDSDKTTVLYNVTQKSCTVFSSKPHMTIYAGASDRNVVGTVSFHSLSSDMDLVVHGHPIQLCRAGMLSSTFTFRSPSIGRGGTMVKWKRDGLLSGGDMECLDENGTVLARFDNYNLALTKTGRLEMGPTVANGGEAMDEIVVSAIAMVEMRRRRDRAAAEAY